jgi:hypothetical protein
VTSDGVEIKVTAVKKLEGSTNVLHLHGRPVT